MQRTSVLPTVLRRFGGAFATLAVAFASASAPAGAAVGTTELSAPDGGGRVTVLYPTTDDAKPVARGPFVFRLAPDAAPSAGNGRLVVLSHGSGGSVWVHADLAFALVEAGFVVAAPWHQGDSARDAGHPGPDSWTKRPGEVSRAIDAVAVEPRFATLAIDRVGLYGMSAGGHTALSLAGGRWSPRRFVAHCEAHIADDFPACVGLYARLTGGFLDPLRKAIALAVLRWRFDDARDRTDHDPRIAAIVAAVPVAADFDPDSLSAPAVPLAIVGAERDRWLAPRFHGDRVLAACRGCTSLVRLLDGGHGALLSPLPPGLDGAERDLLADPPGFDRAAATRTVDDAVVDFFRERLVPSR